MNSISRVVLLSAVSCFVNGTDLSCSFAKQLEGIPKSSINSYNTHHTYINNDLHKAHLSSRLFDDLMISGEEQKVASVCFITDAGNCSGDRFGNTETPGGGNGGGTPNGNDPEYDTIPEQCEDAGYTKTSCPTGQHLVNPCPSDNRYYERCECDNDYSELCNGTDQKGVGEACNGKYKECCNRCSDYPYSSVPAGYVSIGECDSCDGKRYQIKCDNKTYPINSNICGVYGGYGNSCTDDGGTYFRECKCPLNYEWSATALKCVCSSAFKYTCTGTGYAGGDGESCDGKYKACICAEGYSWDAATGKCLLSCANECSLTTCPSPFTCRYEECSKRYCKTGCEAGYDWDASTQTCNSQCSASYKYDESNCPSSQYAHCKSWDTCGGKYTDCKALLFSNDAQIYKTSNATYAASKDLCPGIKDFIQILDSGDGSIDNVIMFNGGAYQSNGLNLCVDADQACYDLAKKIRNANNGDTISINQDMYCGNLPLFNKSRTNTITLLGNNHTLTFKMNIKESLFLSQFKIDSLNITLQEPGYPGRANSPYHEVCDEFYDRGNIFYCYMTGGCILTGNINIHISDSYSSAGTYTIDGGKVNFTCDDDCYTGTVNIKNGGIMNIGSLDDGAYGDIFLYSGATLNIKDYPTQYSNSYETPTIYAVEENTAVNICNWPGTEWYHQLPIAWQSYSGYNRFEGFHTITFNTNKPLSFRNRYNAPSQWESYIIQNTDPNICSQMNF